MKYEKALHTDGSKRIIVYVPTKIAGQLSEDTLNWLSFTTGRYEKLNQEELKWQIVIGPANKVLQKLTDEQQIIFATALADMHRLLVTKLNSYNGVVKQLIDTILEISDILSIAVKKMNLWEVLREVAQEIPVSDLSKIGQREQDTEALTFYENEVYDVLTIAIFAKCLTPLFSSTSTYINDYVDQYAKDILVMKIADGVLEEQVPQTYEKFKHYIWYFVNKFKKKLSLTGQEFTQSFHLNTEQFMCEHVVGKLVTKNFVNADLYHSSGNIMVYTSSVIRDNVQTRETNQSTRKNSYHARTFPAAMNDDPNQESRLELDGLASDHLFDQIPIIRMLVPYAVKEFTLRFDISEEFLDAVRKHYLAAPFVPPTHVMFLCATIFGKQLGGSQSIDLLKYEYLSYFLALLQCISFKLGLHELGHSVSMLPKLDEHNTHIKKTFQTTDDIRLKKGATGSDNFKILKERVSSSWVKDTDRLIALFENLAMEFTESVWVLNTPDAIMQLCEKNPLMKKAIPCLPEDGINGSKQFYPCNIISEIATILVEVLDAD